MPDRNKKLAIATGAIVFLAIFLNVLVGILKVPSKDKILAVVKTSLPATVERCAKEPSFRGDLRFCVGRKGAVTGVTFSGSQASAKCIREDISTWVFPKPADDNASIYGRVAFEVSAQKVTKIEDGKVVHVTASWDMVDADGVDGSPVMDVLESSLPDVLDCFSQHVHTSMGLPLEQLPFSFRLTPQGRMEGIKIGSILGTTNPYGMPNSAGCVGAVLAVLPLPAHNAGRDLKVTTMIKFDRDDL